MNMKKSIREGYVIVESAIVFPLFVLGIISLIFSLRIVGGMEASMHIITDETRLMAAKAYESKYPTDFKQKVRKRIMAEFPFAYNCKISRFNYLINDGRISFKVKYNIALPLPIKLKQETTVTENISARGWIGKNDNNPFGFDAMERNGESKSVYIFPAQGKRYHKKTCTFVNATPSKAVLTSALKKKYKPCRKCFSAKLPEGAIVYCFLKYGDAYHRENCKAVDRYTVTMEKTQAESRGYTPCEKCGGI